MITLFTGQPGNGKTAAVVDFVRKQLAKVDEPDAYRPLYVDGLKGLTLEHTPCNVRNWHNEVPDGAIVVVDEVQRQWRPMGPGQKVPDDIAALETHRHRGIDFYIITQGPKLVHSNVRDLVGRHVHIRDIGILGRWWYEWPECSIANAWKSAPIKKRFKLPKAAFSLYKSASVHVKPVRSFPWLVALVAFLVVVVGVGSWYAMRRINERMHPTPAAPANVAPGPLAGPSLKASEPISAKTIRASFTPRIAAQPETAPAYDGLRKVVNMPRIQGGYCQAGQCYCFIQGGLRAPIDAKACYEWLKNPPFDPYYVAPSSAASASAPQA
jgi:zona occludens toxin